MSGIINTAGSKSGIIGTTELDYEEGYWTAACAADSGSLSIHSATSNSSYTKIGRLVHVHGSYTFENTGTGNLTISGLPFEQYDGTGNAGLSAPTVYMRAMSSQIDTYISGNGAEGDTVVYIRFGGHTDAGESVANVIDAGTFMYWSWTYSTS